MPFMYCDPPAAIVRVQPAAGASHAASGRVTLASGATFEIGMPGGELGSEFVTKLKRTDRVQLCYAPPQRWADAGPNARMAIAGDTVTRAYIYTLAYPGRRLP